MTEATSAKYLSLIAHDTADGMRVRIEGSFEPEQYHKLRATLTTDALERRLAAAEQFLHDRGVEVVVKHTGQDRMAYHATTVPDIFVEGNYPNGPFTTWSNNEWLAKFQLVTRLEGSTVRVGRNTRSAPSFDMPPFVDGGPPVAVEDEGPAADDDSDDDEIYEFHFFVPVDEETFPQARFFPEDTDAILNVGSYATEAQALRAAAGLYGPERAALEVRLALTCGGGSEQLSYHLATHEINRLAEDYSNETGQQWVAQDIAAIPLPVFYELLTVVTASHWENSKRDVHLTVERVRARGIVDPEEALVRQDGD